VEQGQLQRLMTAYDLIEDIDDDVDDEIVMVCSHVTCCLKGELNLDKKWQSDDLFYIIMNEIHPRFNQFCMILKLS